MPRPARSQVYVALLASTALLVPSVLVDKDHVPRWELDTATWFNDAPAWLATLLWPVMQLGTLWAPIVVAFAAVLIVGPRRGLIVVIAGIAAWFVAKVVKEIVERGRPLRYIPDIDVREGAGTGLGFVSGHTTVAFAIATALFPVLSRWGRVIAFSLATVVGVSRVIYGAHLPLDVVGGACLGIAIGCGVDLAARAVTTRR